MKYIKLSRGMQAVVDDIDSDLTEKTWHVRFGRSSYYAARNIVSGGKKIGSETMHRVIAARQYGIDAIKGLTVDHINGNPLDNRRSNLRPATFSQNQANRTRQSNSTTGLKGVTFYPKKNKYRAKITVRGHFKHLGYFDTPSAAADAYAKAAKEYFGEFARTD